MKERKKYERESSIGKKNRINNRFCELNEIENEYTSNTLAHTLTHTHTNVRREQEK